jgi:hypothetical protein
MKDSEEALNGQTHDPEGSMKEEVPKTGIQVASLCRAKKSESSASRSLR